MELIVVPLASKLHGREYYEGLLRKVRGVFEGYGVRVLDIVDSEEGLNGRVVSEVSNSIPILLMLTGGTSRLAVELISKANVRRVLILSHTHHNSLASAISARARVEVEGIAVRIYLCRELDVKECLGVIERVVRVGKALTNLLNTHVGVIGEVSSEDVKSFEEVLNARVSLITYEELEGLINSISGDEVYEVLSKVKHLVDVSSVDESLLKRVIKVYVAMKKLAMSRGLNALAIDCFPYLMKYGVTPCLAISMLNDDGLITACEADLRALTLMLMINSLGFRSSWIANISSVNGRELTLAHCTIAMGLGRDCRLIPHFESGKPYSLACSLREGTYSVVGIDREYSIVALLKAKLIKSGLLSNSMCRTQAVLEANVDLREFPNIALSNHHVLTLGDVIDDLREISYLLLMDFTTYESVIKHMMGEL